MSSTNWDGFDRPLELQLQRARQFLNITPEISLCLQKWIDEAKAQVEDTFAGWPLGQCLSEGALLLFNTRIDSWGIQPSGVVLYGDFDKLLMTSETDLKTIYAVVEYASRKLPELKGALPPQPAGLKHCDTCGGTGVPSAPPGDRGRCLSCDGLGWQIWRVEKPVWAPLAKKRTL